MLRVLDPFRLSAALAVRLARYTVLMVARALHGAEHVLAHAVDATALHWDGEAGWGPRLVVPTIPFLVAFVASAVHSFRVSRLAIGHLVALGIADRDRLLGEARGRHSGEHRRESERDDGWTS